MGPISREHGLELIKDGRPHHSCCGAAVDEQHLFGCTHHRELPPPCPSCRMIDFHHVDCSDRGDATAENPKHYSHPSGVETIRVNRRMTFAAGSAFKYMLRYETKFNPPEDLRKARWYVEDVILYDDPLWLSEAKELEARPLLRRMRDFEANEYRASFFSAILARDLPDLAAAVDSARRSIA